MQRRLQDLGDEGRRAQRERQRRRPSQRTGSSPLQGPLTVEHLAHVQRIAGNRAAASLVAQRHEIEEPPEELESLQMVAQRTPLTAAEIDAAETKVEGAISAAASTSKWRNPILHNTGKAFTKDYLTKRIHDTDPDVDRKAWVGGSAPKLVNLGGRWVLKNTRNDIQGALAHEAAHILQARYEGADEYQDEFNAYWAEYTVKRGGRAPDAAALTTIRGLLVQYGWWPENVPKQPAWSRISAPHGFNLSNSWKQMKLLELMENNPNRGRSATAETVLAHIETMNKVDKVQARDARKANGDHYLPWANYAAADRERIWRALRGAGAAPRG